MRKNAKPITLDRLKECISYDPETGVFRWRIDMRRAKSGEVAGTNMKIGYRSITIDQISYYSHRLAWLYMNGEWPSLQVDHKNEDKADNRWCNLRLASKSQNMLNTRGRSDNTSGAKGVQWSKQKKRWTAHVNIDGKVKYFGSFKTFNEAKRAVFAGREKYHGDFANHGDREKAASTQPQNTPTK